MTSGICCRLHVSFAQSQARHPPGLNGGAREKNCQSRGLSLLTRGQLGDFVPWAT